MHIDGRKIDNSLIEGDICIIGAGAAGVCMALEWLNTPYKVILLEGGGFEYEDKMQDLYDGKITGEPHYPFPLKTVRLHYFGGTTGHWAGMCSPYDPIDFVKRDWVPHSGWPIKREDLDPYYARVHQYLNLGPYEYSVDYWRSKDPMMVPLLSDNPVIWNKMWQFSRPVSRFGQKYRKTIVGARNIHLYTYANVTDIVASEDVSMIKEVIAKNHEGKEHKVRAKKFVLACNTIQNARTLLASNRQNPKGLGNEHDQVGRKFMEHIEFFSSAELWLKKPDTLKLYMARHETKVRAELAISEEQQWKHKMLNGTVSLRPLVEEKRQQTMPGAANKDDIAYELIIRMEQAPNLSSRVTLSAEKDPLGVPRASLNWELTPLEKRSLRKIYELLGQEVRRQRVGLVKMCEFLSDENDMAWPSTTSGGPHHMGTTAMSDNPKEGVVDKNCKIHSISNLYVAGASCFTTGAAPNPTLTLTALSLRLSDHLKETIK